ncbi:hypothetical protein FPV67DRAFT_1452213 [Lyophyllum atratum]|nr:hypothetical protein FPV67DRAFT_1452213 [Lyophyllum atratum]
MVDWAREFGWAGMPEVIGDGELTELSDDDAGSMPSLLSVSDSSEESDSEDSDFNELQVDCAAFRTGLCRPLDLESTSSDDEPNGFGLLVPVDGAAEEEPKADRVARWVEETAAVLRDGDTGDDPFSPWMWRPWWPTLPLLGLTFVGW